jgi:predicted rRNA methylase YqxC with S4 and FtsJ domains
VVAECAQGLAALGLTLHGLFDSPVTGMGGNREAFALLSKDSNAGEGA